MNSETIEDEKIFSPRRKKNDRSDPTAKSHATQLLTELSHDYEKVIQTKEEDIDKQNMAKQNQLAKLELEKK